MRVLGLDGGIASIGWAVVEEAEDKATILGAGVRMFDAPETDKDRTPKNAIRREKRGQRRVIRRRRQRMAAIRSLFMRYGLLPGAGKDALHRPGLDPWRLRATGIERVLTAEELAVALGHIARHRGFRSNAKRERNANAVDDTSKMLKAIAATQERLGGRTVGQLFADEPRKRNRNGDYSRSVLRKDLEDEVRQLFAAQRRLGSDIALQELQAAFSKEAFFQLPMQDSEHLVKRCRFEPGERCTARRSYAFELFRLLSRLANLTLVSGGQEWTLDPAQIGRIAADFGRAKKITYRSIRKLLELDPRTRFAAVEDESQDVVARAGNAAEGTATLRDVVGDAAWHALLNAPLQLDRLFEVLSFRNDPATIRQGLAETGLEPVILETIMAAVAQGRFDAFSGAGHISAKAARKLIPHLAKGLVYSEACREVEYDHTAQSEFAAVDLASREGHQALARLLDEQVRNPVARKAISEMLKQVRAIVHEFGVPDLIHVELARDVGKSAEERDRIKRGIDDRTKTREGLRQEFAELLGHPPGSAEDMLRFELWKEQNYRCLYTDELIPPDAIVATSNLVQVDHILPWSRFGDDSFPNKTLCMAHANQAKRSSTPFEWLGKDEAAWACFAARVEGCKEMKGFKKRRYYLRRNAEEVEEAFRTRNLNDTRYACRLLLALLARLYPQDGNTYVRARPGQLTAKLRRAWGIEDLKKDENGKRREDDRHHALDALVVAATSQSMLQCLTEASKDAERAGLPRGFDFKDVREPWVGFRDAARAIMERVFVSRAERRRARGEAHAATIKQVREVDGESVVFERKAVEKLTLGDLERIPVPAPYGKIGDPARLQQAMVTELQRWIEAGKPKDAPPLSPKGDVIRKVRVATKDKVAVEVRGGTADRGDMARVDVFAKADKKGRKRFYLVPIYPHQIADKVNCPAPPNRSVVAYADEEDWDCIDDSFVFLFSLHTHSLIEVIKADGEVIFGYFKGLHRGTGAIAISPQQNPRLIRGGIGAKTLAGFRKLAVDRLGWIRTIEHEERTWRGEVCT